MDLLPSLPAPTVSRLDIPRQDETGAAPGSRVFLPRQAMNPLVEAAHPLLEMGALLRHAAQAPAIPLEELRTRLAAMVRAFVDRCADVGTDTLAAARYCLCTFLDESVAATPWGGGAWSTRSLLVIFHGEASGGERFFTILHKLSQNPAANIDALELLYIMLALGMQGRYRLSPDGAAALEQVRDKLRVLIRGVRGARETDLSPRWRGRNAPPARTWLARPLWWVLLGTVCALISLHVYLQRRLREQAHPAALAREAVHLASPMASIAPTQPVARISPVAPSAPSAPSAPDAPDAPDAQIAPLTPVTPAASSPMTPALPMAALPPGSQPLFAPGLAQALAADLAARRVSVERRADRTIVTLNTDGMFASGSARVAAAYLPLIRRIGNALRDVPGQVVVVGHTDNQQPAPGTPSNWALSLSRATQVVDLLRQETGQPERFLAQGKGDTDPVASNDTSYGQARNRRVVIAILAPGASF
jgi:type VI secretion system protein ImpK